MEVPCRFPARVPLVVAYFGSWLLFGSGGHRVYAHLATPWVVEAARGWYADVVRREYQWHLQPTLVESIEALGLRWLAQGAGDLAQFLLKGTISLHNQLDWERLEPFLRRSKRLKPGAGTDPPRDCFTITQSLVHGKLLLRKGLVDSSLPYADGVTPTTSPPVSGWATTSATTRRGAGRVATRGRGRAAPASSSRVSTPTLAGEEPTQAPP